MIADLRFRKSRHVSFKCGRSPEVVFMSMERLLFHHATFTYSWLQVRGLGIRVIGYWVLVFLISLTSLRQSIEALSSLPFSPLPTSPLPSYLICTAPCCLRLRAFPISLFSEVEFSGFGFPHVLRIRPMICGRWQAHGLA